MVRMHLLQVSSVNRGQHHIRLATIRYTLAIGFQHEQRLTLGRIHHCQMRTNYSLQVWTEISIGPGLS